MEKDVEKNDCPKQNECKCIDRWCSKECLEKSRGKCFVSNKGLWK